MFTSHPIRAIAAVGIAGISCVVLLAPGSSAAAKGPVKATFNSTSPVTGATFGQAFPSTSRCDPGALPCNQQVTPAAGFDRTFTGSINGTGKSAEALNQSAYLENGTYQFVTWFRVTGTVSSCGSGSFILEEVGTITPNSPTSPPPAWRILPKSGTGALAKLSGGGTAVFTGFGANGAWTGKLTC